MNIFGDINSLLGNYYTFFLEGILTTIILSLFGTVVGLFLGTLLAFGKNIKVMKNDNKIIMILKNLLKGICNIYSIIIRGTPMMVQAMIFKYTCQSLGVDWNRILPNLPIMNGWVVAGLIVITFNTAAYMCEIIRSGINGVDRGQYEGARSLGLSHLAAMFKIVLPQAIRNSIPTIGNEWIVNIKDSSVLNVIGISELYFQATTVANQGYKYIAAYLIVASIYLILTLMSTGILKVIEMKLDHKKFKFSLFHFSKKGA